MSTAPFLLLSTRDQDAVAQDEHASVARFLEVPLEEVHQVRLEQGPLPTPDLDGYAGIVLGGSPFTSITPRAAKTEVQRRVEHELRGLLRTVHRDDRPFLGLCYGVGTFGRFMGGTVDTAFAEPSGSVELTVTAAGRDDPILEGVPGTFHGIVGHKEALSALPPEAVLLVTGRACPFQLWRVGTRQYVSQFHPEMDAASLEARMIAYLHSGYFAPEEFDAILAGVRATSVEHAHRVLTNFGALARRDHDARR